ncbi:LysR substrate-binding domain-containing protein [Chelativorans xinjiangense]|uniref:LysR substrate-binding domain-containing protein n=1 Tax=Chelativorans xinjiangense TaxID=2681485 RepID=UPI0013597F01|nr:LysR substrate-binding domain-containing protein [Chelativorans xinjiangense]
MRRLPSLRGLQAFEAVARMGNLAGAAEALRITPSAVSHRIRGLEEELGLQLLRRLPNGLGLTAAGRRYRAGVEDAFAQLARATAELLGPDLSRPLTVSVTSEVGTRWLMPRFYRFRELHPDIDIAILSTYHPTNLAAGEADLALRWGEGNWPGLQTEPILRFRVTPLCAPELKARIAGLTPAEVVAKNILIRDIDDSYDDWDLWLDAAGAGGVKPARHWRFEDYSMGIKAAIDGQGIVLGYLGYVEREIASGALVQPFDLTVPVKKGYHLTYPQERLSDPRVRAFRDWVISEREPALREQ